MAEQHSANRHQAMSLRDLKSLLQDTGVINRQTSSLFNALAQSHQKKNTTQMVNIHTAKKFLQDIAVFNPTEIDNLLVGGAKKQMTINSFFQKKNPSVSPTNNNALTPKSPKGQQNITSFFAPHKKQQNNKKKSKITNKKSLPPQAPFQKGVTALDQQLKTLETKPTPTPTPSTANVSAKLSQSNINVVQKQKEDLLRMFEASKIQGEEQKTAIQTQLHKKLDEKNKILLYNLSNEAKEIFNRLRRALDIPNEDVLRLSEVGEVTPTGAMAARIKLEKLDRFMQNKKREYKNIVQEMVGKLKRIHTLSVETETLFRKKVSDILKLYKGTMDNLSLSQENLRHHIKDCDQLLAVQQAQTNLGEQLGQVGEKIEIMRQKLKFIIILRRQMGELLRPLKQTGAFDTTTFNVKRQQGGQFPNDGEAGPCLTAGENAMSKVRKICAEHDCHGKILRWTREQKAYEEQFHNATKETESLDILKPGALVGAQNSKEIRKNLQIYRDDIIEIKKRVKHEKDQMDLELTILTRFVSGKDRSGSDDKRIIMFDQNEAPFAAELDKVISKMLQVQDIKLTPDSCPVKSKTKCDINSGGIIPAPFAFQRLAEFVGSPKIVGEGGELRLALVWRTGAGKTLGVIKMLDNFFDDPRPKVLIFPEHSVRDNFYSELATFHNKYLEFAVKRGTHKDWKEHGTNKFKFGLGPRPKKDKVAIKEWDANFIKVLEKLGRLDSYDMRNMNNIKQKDIDKPLPPGTEPIGVCPGGAYGFGGNHAYLKAPLRCIVYADAYNSNIKGCEKGKGDENPCPPLFKRRTPMDPTNPYTGMVVVMDEAHNLLSPENNPKYNTAEVKSLQTLTTKLRDARNSAMFFLTATPIVSHPKEGENFMKIVKGSLSKTESNKGYILYMNSSPKPLYPTVNPKNYLNTTRIMAIPVVSEMLLELNGGAVKLKPVPTSSPNPQKRSSNNTQSAQSILNIGRAKMKTGPKENEFGTEPLELRLKYMQNPWSDNEVNMRVQKFAQVAEYIKLRGVRTLVLCDLDKGLWLFREILERVLQTEVGILTTPPTRIVGKGEHRITPIENGRRQLCCRLGDGRIINKKGVKHGKGAGRVREDIKSYNDNMLKRYVKNELSYIVADGKKFSEGVSFKFTDLLILMNPPVSWAVAKQQFGRAERSCSSTKNVLDIMIVVSTLKTDLAAIQKGLEENQTTSATPSTSAFPVFKWDDDKQVSSTNATLQQNPIPLTADELQMRKLIQQRNIIEPAMEKFFDNIQIGRDLMIKSLGLQNVNLKPTMSIEIINDTRSIKDAVKAGARYTPKKGQIGKYMKALHQYYYQAYPEIVRKAIQEKCGNQHSGSSSSSSSNGKIPKGRKKKKRGNGKQSADDQKTCRILMDKVTKKSFLDTTKWVDSDDFQFLPKHIQDTYKINSGNKSYLGKDTNNNNSNKKRGGVLSALGSFFNGKSTSKTVATPVPTSSTNNTTTTATTTNGGIMSTVGSIFSGNLSPGAESVSTPASVVNNDDNNDDDIDYMDYFNF